VLAFEEEKSYHVVVQAFDDLGKFAEGSAVLVYTKDRPAASEETLMVQPKMANWRNGQTVNEGSELELTFAVPNDPRCEGGITFEHRFDKPSGTVPVVNVKDVVKVTAVSGRQSHVVQASCGDVRGKPVEVYWYGVPADYQPLMLKIVKADAYGIGLAKEDDCPLGLLQIECASGEAEFKAEACKLRGNIIPITLTGAKVRGRCGSTAGPATTLN
jgi:hypothetical protein